MMEIPKVNIETGYVSEEYKRLLDAIYGISPLSPKEIWLDQVCPVIRQNDFDTCRGGYSDENYDTFNGYRQSYNTYLDQFENW